ncbi:MAG: hypothetical protein HY913_12150 [Desulfomonile tiedjei]|nr:hypothetical protein [Desulfomonile tiedjei]
MKSLTVALVLVLFSLVQADAQSYSRGGYQSSRTTVDVRVNSDQGSYSARSFSSYSGPVSRRIYRPRYIGPVYPGTVYYPQFEGTYFSTGDSSIMMGTEYMVPVRPVVPVRPYRYRYR